MKGKNIMWDRKRASRKVYYVITPIRILIIMGKLTIEVERDAHDDTYYRVLNESHILMDRINDREDLMMYLENKIKSME
jgi:hypothetical protein